MLIDARQQSEKEPKSFGNKRNAWSTNTGPGYRTATYMVGQLTMRTTGESVPTRRFRLSQGECRFLAARCE